ncbi:MAG: SpoIIIAH-like family protein [Clostridiales bacterium]|nr:SpoIIIAH-like family protein [Clostridiales bacterium]
MLTVKRKNLVLGMLVILLVITGYLNFVYNQNTLNNRQEDNLLNKEDEQPIVTVKDASKGQEDNQDNQEDISSEVAKTSSSGGFFVEYRFERESTRKKEIDYIKEIVNNPNSEAEMKNEAQAQLLEITSNMEKELNIEGLLKAKGFSDSIVIFNQDYVSVIVDKQELAPEEVAQILDIVKRESGKAADNIKIIPTNQ